MSENRNIIRVEGTDRVFHRYKILAVLLIPLSMALMQVSSINVALPTIEVGLDATSTDLQWVLSGYALMFGIMLIPAGRLGDVMGRGSWFVIGLVIFTLASLACGLAPTADTLNIARFVQGIGAGLFNPQTMGMIQQYFSGQGRAKAFALFGMVVAVSVAIGPVVAGTVIELLGPELGWRGTFVINAPIGAVGVALALSWFPFGRERARRRDRRGAGRGAHRERLDLDPVGSILIALTVLMIMVPFLSPSGGRTFLLVVLAGLLLRLWMRWERAYARRGHRPMVDLRLFRFPSFTHGTAVAGTFFLGSTSIFVVVAVYLQSGLGVDAFHAGLIGLPNAAVSAVTSLAAGRYALTHGHRLVVGAVCSIIAGVLASIGVLLLVQSHGISFWWLMATLCLCGAGQGAMGSVNQTLSLQDVPVADGGTAGGIKSTAERIGTAIGNAMVTAVFFGLAATRSWEAGFYGGFGVIAGVLTLCLAIAVFDLRSARSGDRAARAQSRG